MLRGKPSGVKILWVWAIGTAAVLVANVARTGMRDVQKLIKQEEEQRRINDVEFVIEDGSTGYDNEAAVEEGKL